MRNFWKNITKRLSLSNNGSSQQTILNIAELNELINLIKKFLDAESIKEQDNFLIVIDILLQGTSDPILL